MPWAITLMDKSVLGSPLSVTCPDDSSYELQCDMQTTWDYFYDQSMNQCHSLDCYYIIKVKTPVLGWFLKKMIAFTLNVVNQCQTASPSATKHGMPVLVPC